MYLSIAAYHPINNIVVPGMYLENMEIYTRRKLHIGIIIIGIIMLIFRFNNVENFPVRRLTIYNGYFKHKDIHQLHIFIMDTSNI